MARTAELVSAERAAGSLSPERLGTVLRGAAAEAGSPAEEVSRAVYQLVVRDPQLHSTDPDTAIEETLSLLTLFARLSHASLWIVENTQETCVARVGTRVTVKRLRRLARRAAAGTASRDDGTLPSLQAVVVRRWDRPWGTVVVDAKPRGSERALFYVEEAARTLSALLERKLLLTQRLETAEHVLEVADRRIIRLGFDIHDGPLQELALLLAELTAFDGQLETLIPEDGPRRIVRRRVADLTTLAVELAGGLRELVLAGAYGTRPLRETLEQTVARLERRACTSVDLVVRGDVESTTASQRIVVARVVEEALANVREHSRARNVSVEVERRDGLLRVGVTDDGCGFDVARAVRRAARNRRYGLTVMSERTKLLGGRLEIASRPGGPTAISAYLPAWSADGTRTRASGAA